MGSARRMKCPFSASAAAQQEEVLPSLSSCMSAHPASILCSSLVLLLAEVHLPEVVATFEGCQVVECLAILGDDGAAHVGRVRGEAHHTVFDAFQLYDDVFRLVIFFVSIAVFLVVFLLLSLFCLGGVFSGRLLCSFSSSLRSS